MIINTYILKQANMKVFFTAILLLILASTGITYSQQYVDNNKFFADTTVLQATLTLNMAKLYAKRDIIGFLFPAIFSCTVGDGMKVNDHIDVEVRGHSRRALCYVPPLKLIFKGNETAAFYHLKNLKLVNTCKIAGEYDQYIIKEFLCYKIYNLITDKSFRARLLDLTYNDSSGKRRPMTIHSFLIEDEKEMAKRTGNKVMDDVTIATQATNRKQMTMVALFEYMIGNTDWAVSVNHNTKLMKPKADSTARPLVVPYDFDYSGLVNTNYAVPEEKLGIESVRERLYRGFPRSMDELNEALDIFWQQKPAIYATINSCNLLNKRSKTEMTQYLDEFFTSIKKPSFINDTFISNARTE
jgi:hypothetical protein